MRKTISLIVMILMLSSFGLAEEVHFLKHPSILPDGSRIVFSYDGDLWIVSSKGGTAYRLTALAGEESHPRISPDGKWLAFAGRQTGDANLYVMPLDGGEIKQLTFNDSAETPNSWTWDSSSIYFTSDGYNDFTVFKVSREGGTPVRLFENYFNTPHDLVVNPVTRDYLFTDSWESNRFANRKGYKGDYNPDIKSYNPQTKEFKILTDYRGKDFQPVIDKNGNLYFISDEANGEFNLYALENGKRTQLTNFDSSIINIQISVDGKSIVFERDYQIWLYDVAEKKSQKLAINLSRFNTLATESEFNTDNNISFFNVSPDGKKIAFVSRGVLFVSDIEGKFINRLSASDYGRVVEVLWMKDNKTLLYTKTVDGWLNLFTMTADGKSAEKQFTSDKANNRNISFNSDRTKAVFLRGRNDVRLLETAGFKIETIYSDELWGFYGSQPYFSPDDKYIAFTAYRNFEQDIFIYDIAGKKALNITDSGVTEANPFWSPDGKYLYFSSDRFTPDFPRGGRGSKIYRIPLEKIDREFRSTEFEKLFIEEKEKPKRDDKKDKEEPKKTETVVVSIDFKDLIQRSEQVSPNPGAQDLPFVIIQKDETMVLYQSNHDGERTSLWKTAYKPFEASKTSKITGTETNDYLINSAKDINYALINGSINTLDLKENKAKPIKINYIFRKNLRGEFDQMFFETWANLQENYYDENFHGRDWNKIRTYYSSFLPYIQSRSDLRRLLGDMLGELNSSHIGFYSNGDEENTFYKFQTMQTGIVFDDSNPYLVKDYIKKSPVDKKGISIKSGDLLTAVNGIPVDPNKNREYYFNVPSIDQEINLTFKRNGKTFDVKIHPINTRTFKGLLYDEWIDANQRFVDEKSDNRIAYIQMKDMGGTELSKFIIEMTTEWYKKDALILDLRFNTGGNVHDDVLQFLSQKPYLQWKYRGGKFSPQPNFAPAEKPIVLLVNEQSLSDAEMTAAGFKALKLGKIIGTETYRWLIFTSGKALVDGSFYRLPSWGCFTLDGKDIELNGVAPDIYVTTDFKNRLEAKDPQLDKAIEEILRDIRK